MADYYKNAIEEMLKDLNEDDLVFYYTLMARTLWRTSNGMADV